MSHTPGPWTVQVGVCRRDHPDTSADVHGRDGQFVADCGCHESANANARVIAAALDAIEACRAIVAAHSALFVGRPLCIDGQPIDHTLLNHANALAGLAVAKAEGREPAKPESAQPCGCDEGANWKCDQHRGEAVRS